VTAADTSRAAIVVMTVAVLAQLAKHALFADVPALVAAQVLAGLVMLWARVTFGRRSFHGAANPTEGGLVTTGPYRFIRHPIYSAILFFLWLGVASHPSWGNAALAFIASAAAAVRIVSEERLVLARYPEYTAYAARTKLIIPFIL
jgi:protein-S-isoprenylcysteine O-methyltransferase Ste14